MEADAPRRRSVAELMEFVRFPTVSAQPEHADDLKKCAQWLAGHLTRIGMRTVRVMPTGGHPIVYAAETADRSAPTVLIYGHYDVQPADPLGEWRSPPFEPAIRGNNLYGRGACDNKGQMFAHVKAIESCLRRGGLPVNVKCVFEGEEETGSRHLKPFLAAHRRTLRCDAAVISDMPMLGPNRPAITYSLRGSLGLELTLEGQKRDLHSGIYGGAIHNPLQALCELLAALHDADARIAIPGVYDGVHPESEAERAFMAKNGPSDASILRDAGARAPWGEPNFTLYERTTIRPALTINGVTGGYQGPGGKGVIPARASAKISFRLAPGQDPAQVGRLFREQIRRLTPQGMAAQVRTLAGAPAAVVDRGHPALAAASFAYRKGFGVSPAFVRCGGTIPVANLIQETLGVPPVLMGFALPDDRMHAPNEKFHLPNFFRGIATSIWFLSALRRMRRRG